MNRKELNSFKQSVYRSLNEEIGGGQPKPPQPFPVPSGPTSPQPFPNPSGPTPSPKPLPYPRPYGYRYQTVPPKPGDLDNINNNDLPRLPSPTQQNAPKPNYGPGYFHWDISVPNWPRPSDITNPGRLPQYRYPSGMLRFNRFWNPVHFV